MENQEKVEELKRSIAALESEKAQLNPNVGDDRFRITVIDQQIVELQAQIREAAAQEDEQKVHEEVQEIVLGHDFSAALGHPDANKIIYKLLYDERLTQLQMIREKNEALEAERAAHQATAAALEAEKVSRAEVLEKLAAIVAERDKLEEGNTLLMNETRHLRNEVARLETKVRTMEGQLEIERKKASSFIPANETLGALLEEAKQTTKQKRLVKCLRPLDGKRSRYIGTLEDGTEKEISWLELGQYEEVEDFPAPPTGDMVDEPAVTEADLAQQGREVAAAAEEAERFQDVVRGDTTDEAAEGSTGEVLEANDEVPGADVEKQATVEQRLKSLELITREMLVWKAKVNDRLFTPVNCADADGSNQE